ncbi:hypothetical protein BB561_001910 [Smittium simulii]|uniref:Uncharacterized protein n=1 Tax=Smittium simulii TaxID=133385 RepID=A0A2T9YSN4_9FUNG|nr:hypothetical protein BB561_001910 [Smittium simulii]
MNSAKLYKLDSNKSSCSEHIQDSKAQKNLTKHNPLTFINQSFLPKQSHLPTFLFSQHMGSNQQNVSLLSSDRNSNDDSHKVIQSLVFNEKKQNTSAFDQTQDSDDSSNNSLYFSAESEVSSAKSSINVHFTNADNRSDPADTFSYSINNARIENTKSATEAASKEKSTPQTVPNFGLENLALSKDPRNLQKDSLNNTNSTFKINNTLFLSQNLFEHDNNFLSCSNNRKANQDSSSKLEESPKSPKTKILPSYSIKTKTVAGNRDGIASRLRSRKLALTPDSQPAQNSTTGNSIKVPVMPSEESFCNSEDDCLDAQNGSTDTDRDVSYIDKNSFTSDLGNSFERDKNNQSYTDSEIVDKYSNLNGQDSKVGRDLDSLLETQNQNLCSDQELTDNEESWSVKCVNIYPIIQESLQTESQHVSDTDINLDIDSNFSQDSLSEKPLLQDRNKSPGISQNSTDSSENHLNNENQTINISKSHTSQLANSANSINIKKKINWGNCYIFKSTNTSSQSSNEFDSQDTLKDDLISQTSNNSEETPKTLDSKSPTLKPIIKRTEDLSDYINLKTSRVANSYSLRAKKPDLSLVKVIKFKYLDDESDSDF